MEGFRSRVRSHNSSREKLSLTNKDLRLSLSSLQTTLTVVPAKVNLKLVSKTFWKGEKGFKTLTNPY